MVSPTAVHLRTQLPYIGEANMREATIWEGVSSLVLWCRPQEGLRRETAQLLTPRAILLTYCRHLSPWEWMMVPRRLLTWQLPGARQLLCSRSCQM